MTHRRTVADSGFSKGTDHGQRGLDLKWSPQRGPGRSPLKLKVFVRLDTKDRPKVKDLNDSLPRIWGRLLLAAMTIPTFGQQGVGATQSAYA